LRDTLVDDVHAQFSQTVHVCLTRAEVSTLNRVVKESVNAITVVFVVLGGVDTTLSRDTVRAPRGVLKTEGLHSIAKLTERSRGGCASESSSDHDNGVLSLVSWKDELD
jgi:hypothetical protein